MKTKYNKVHRAVDSLTADIVFVTKYRKPILTDKLLTELESIFASILHTRCGEMIAVQWRKRPRPSFGKL